MKTPILLLKGQMSKKIEIKHITEDFSIAEIDHKCWENADGVSVDKYWSGETAPGGRHFSAKLLWSDAAFYVRFEAHQDEPLNVSEKPNLQTKTSGLWERDVCEIFIAPDAENFRKYFEFEIAPNGEWIDLAIYQMPDRRETDFDYDSKMQSAARIEKDKILMAIKIQWQAFGKTPQAGDVWKGNILRCVGSGANRGFLAWSPTETVAPNFHVPEKFGDFEFVKSLQS